MNLIYIYESKDEADSAKAKLTCENKIVSDREDNQVIYKLFAQASWSVLYQLDMFNLKELQSLIADRKNNQSFNSTRHAEIIRMLEYPAKSFDLIIPKHWK